MAVGDGEEDGLDGFGGDGLYDTAYVGLEVHGGPASLCYEDNGVVEGFQDDVEALVVGEDYVREVVTEVGDIKEVGLLSRESEHGFGGPAPGVFVGGLVGLEGCEPHGGAGEVLVGQDKTAGEEFQPGTVLEQGGVFDLGFVDSVVK